MSEEIPEMQWSITCPLEGKVKLMKIPVPKPVSGEVLIKCMAAPINPSDIAFMKG
jgi:NADPH:quinone reductase-like Zn-dependent oxidoreductase